MIVIFITIDNAVVHSNNTTNIRPKFNRESRIMRLINRNILSSQTRSYFILMLNFIQPYLVKYDENSRIIISLILIAYLLRLAIIHIINVVIFFNKCAYYHQMPLIEFKAVAQATNELLKNNGRKYFILCTQVIFGIILSQKSIKMLCHSKIGFKCH